MPLDFIVQTIKKIESYLKTEEECENPLIELSTPFPQDSGTLRRSLMQSTQVLPQGKIINGFYYGDAYCVKCKAPRQFIGDILTSDSGRRMAKGKCGVCDTKVNRIISKDL